MKQRADLIIVGGGPAGSMAALAAAGRGLSVLLLDAASFPRDKPCGGGLSCRVQRRFPEVSSRVLSSIPVNTITRVVLDSPAGERVVSESDEPLYLMVRRCDFDAALLGLAREAGTRVLEGVRVSRLEQVAQGLHLHAADGSRFEARAVIGADGVNSLIAKASGLNPHWPVHGLAVTTTEETPFETLRPTSPHTMYVAYGYKNHVGYGYIFPKVRHLDLGVGYLLSYMRERLDRRPRRHHEGFVEECARDGLLEGTCDQRNFRAWLQPVAGPLSPSYADRVLLCGDAGGFVNGFTGEGIYYAMVSGEHAGRTAAEALGHDGCSASGLSLYQKRWEAEIGNELRLSLRIRSRLFRHPGAIDALVRAASRNRKLREHLTGVAIGENDVSRRRIAWHLLLATLEGHMGLRSLVRLGLPSRLLGVRAG